MDHWTFRIWLGAFRGSPHQFHYSRAGHFPDREMDFEGRKSDEEVESSSALIFLVKVKLLAKGDKHVHRFVRQSIDAALKVAFPSLDFFLHAGRHFRELLV